MIYLLLGTWAFIAFSGVLVFWHLQNIGRKVETIWDFFYRRAEVSALKEGWIRPKAQHPLEDAIGFVAPAPTEAKLEEPRK